MKKKSNITTMKPTSTTATAPDGAMTNTQTSYGAAPTMSAETTPVSTT